jgi:hypothetical protein
MGLLNKNPKMRLGSKNGIRDIRSHDFLRDVNWMDMERRKIKPPIRLNPRKSNFDTEYTNLPIIDDPTDHQFLDNTPTLPTLDNRFRGFEFDRYHEECDSNSDPRTMTQPFFKIIPTLKPNEFQHIQSID